MSPLVAQAGVRGWKVVLAFAAVYLIWGSTYLGIRIALETLPPFFMAGVRFVIAGGLLWLVTRVRGEARPTPRQVGAAVVAGGLMLLGGNGGVVWAEQHVSSGLAALLVAMTPLWMTLLQWLGPRRLRPTPATVLGLCAGLVGMLVLIDPARLSAGAPVHLGAATVLLFSSLCWSLGSLYTRGGRLPPSPLVAITWEMLGGGALLLVAAALHGEAPRVLELTVSARSLVALGYLIFFGSIVAFSAYVFLLRVTTPARAATYAYVNPVVALALGYALGGEPLGPRTLAGAAIIVAAVVLITRSRAEPGDPARAGTERVAAARRAA